MKHVNESSALRVLSNWPLSLSSLLLLSKKPVVRAFLLSRYARLFGFVETLPLVRDSEKSFVYEESSNPHRSNSLDKNNETLFLQYRMKKWIWGNRIFYTRGKDFDEEVMKIDWDFFNSILQSRESTHRNDFLIGQRDSSSFWSISLRLQRCATRKKFLFLSINTTLISMREARYLGIIGYKWNLCQLLARIKFTHHWVGVYGLRGWEPEALLRPLCTGPFVQHRIENAVECLARSLGDQQFLPTYIFPVNIQFSCKLYIVV